MIFPADRKILEVLAELTDSGYPVKRICGRLGHSGSSWSGQISYALQSLEMKGCVARLDGEKPIVWCITEAGRTALAKP